MLKFGAAPVAYINAWGVHFQASILNSPASGRVKSDTEIPALQWGWFGTLSLAFGESARGDITHM